uniref:QWRF motif-containing protein 4 n=1 Tax=Erigeron canadensis TaxID=72917 RepID=UPI001CB89B1E|nr:QWRF motif-containing protein 4 [Erigeron canadensis]
MDVYESNQALETTRNPELLHVKNHGILHHPLTREGGSRYKSPTPRRFPSPSVTRTVTPPPAAAPATAPKRAVSTGRRLAVTPPSPTTPVHDTSVYTELAARKASGGSKLPESLWPSRMRSLSVAFQSNSYSMPVSKKEKPPPQAVYDRTLKPSSNVTHKQPVSSPTYRKATPERKRSPLKGKSNIDQSENSKPLDGLNSRLVDQHRWPSRTVSNVLNKSIDLSTETIKNITSPNLRRMSLPGDRNRPQRISNLVSSSSLEKNDGSLQSSPNNLTSGSRGVSPSRTRAMISAPSRGVSPNRMRSSSPSKQLCNSNNTVSVLTFIADIKKGKNVANRIEDAHHLRLLYNRQVQWRFVNANSEAMMNSLKITAEKSLINAQRTMSQLQDLVAAKRINICQLKLQLKLYLALNHQIAYLNQWSSIEREHGFSLHGVIEDLQASTLRLPVTGCAMANIQSVKSAVYSAIQVMQTIGSSLQSTLSRLEETNWLVSELSTVIAQERALLDECESLMASTSSLQVEEYSLRTNLVQSN